MEIILHIKKISEESKQLHSLLYEDRDSKSRVAWIFSCYLYLILSNFRYFFLSHFPTSMFVTQCIIDDQSLSLFWRNMNEFILCPSWINQTFYSFYNFQWPFMTLRYNSAVNGCLVSYKIFHRIIFLKKSFIKKKSHCNYLKTAKI